MDSTAPPPAAALSNEPPAPHPSPSSGDSVPAALWLDTGAAPRPRDRRAEAKQLFIPGGLALAGATAFGLVMVFLPTPQPPLDNIAVAADDRVWDSPANRGEPAQVLPEPVASDGAPQSGAATNNVAVRASRLPVVVLHASSAKATGDEVSDMLRQNGWSVSQQRTAKPAVLGAAANREAILYPAGGRSAARRVERALPGRQTLRRSQAVPPADAVTVVVADN